jgi:hypothetical protein
MRTNLTFNLAGKSKKEIELKLKERIAAYLDIDVEEVEEKTDIEIAIFVGEEGPMDLTFSADCRVKVKS